MNEIFSWWTGSNLQIAIVLFCVLCALGTLVSIALTGSDKRSPKEQQHDDEEQARAVRKSMRAGSAWGEKA
jgi:flagellar basal body-associated protein FliL